MATNSSKTRPRWAFTLIEVLVVIAIIGATLGLILPAIQRVRAASARTICRNNLKQHALALHAYHEAHRRLPPGCSYQGGKDPQLHMSWMTRILPFLEQEALWQLSLAAYRDEPFFEAPPHRPILGQRMPVFLCPSDDISDQPFDYEAFRVAFTDYLGVEGRDFLRRDGVLFTDSNLTLGEISDGTATTLMIGERPPTADHELGWWYAGWGQNKTGSADVTLGVREICVHPRYWRCPRGPYDFEPGSASNLCDAFHFWSFHPGGANFAFCDGSVRFIAYSANPIMPALATRAGGEAVTAAE